MLPADDFAAGKIRRCPCHPQQAVTASGAEPQFPEHLPQQRLSFRRHPAEGFQPCRRDLAVIIKRLIPVSDFLYLHGPLCLLPQNGGGNAAAGIFLQFLKRQRRYLHTQIHTVKNRLADPMQIGRNIPGCTTAAVHIRIIPAMTGVHGRQQQEIRRKSHCSCTAGNHDFLIFHRLAQDLQADLGKFRKLIKEQNSRQTWR